MIIGVCTVQLHLPGSHSLKDKRQVLQPLLARIRRDHNVSVAEIDQQDAWQMATLGIACVSNDSAYAHGLLSRIVALIPAWRMDVEVIDYAIEIC